MHRGFFLPVKAFPPAPNGPGTGGGRCHATYLCGERFNSRPPRGGRHRAGGCTCPMIQFQSTPSARRATPFLAKHIANRRDFNPRPPRGERRKRTLQEVAQYIFQSTPSARRATTPTRIPASTHTYFNPRPPRGGRPFQCSHRMRSGQFQSTPSARRATG